MFWIQLSTFILFNVLILAMLASQAPAHWFSLTSPQHAGAGEGSYTVWHLIADVEAEHRAAERERERERHFAERDDPLIPEFPTADPDEPTGRHHLRT
jgi:hypothetical protein